MREVHTRRRRVQTCLVRVRVRLASDLSKEGSDPFEEDSRAVFQSYRSSWIFKKSDSWRNHREAARSVRNRRLIEIDQHLAF